MDLISRISQHFTDSVRTKLDAVELLAAPIAGAVELMVGALVGNGKILAQAMGVGRRCSAFCRRTGGSLRDGTPGLAAIALTTDSSRS